MSPDADAVLAALNEEQRAAATSFGRPLAILAGAGTGKTRTLTSRVAYGALTEALDPKRTLIVTFTRDAASEMRARLAALGVHGPNAATFHSAALAQLRHLWPAVHAEPAPELIDSSFGLVARAAKPHLEGAERYTPTRDLVAEIEWAKTRRIAPDAYAAAVAATGRETPVAPATFERVYAGYERAKKGDGRWDFTDLLAALIELLETDAPSLARVHARYAHFSVDEYQDTSPLAETLLSLWLGGRPDLAVVGDPEQTIYTFAGADSTFLTGFRRRYRDAAVVELRTNYRSSPEVIALANRLAGPPGSTGRLRASAPSGPAPVLVEAPDAEGELGALSAEVTRLIGEGVEPSEIAILVRLNAALVPIEAALARGGVAYRVWGDAFFARPDVRRIVEDLGAAARRDPAVPAPETLRAILARRFGYDPDAPVVGDEAAGRAAAAETLLGLASAATDLGALVAEIAARSEAEADGSADGVNLLTVHRAKGLEWEAVLLPGWEETVLPIRQALGNPTAIAEERRLAYVAVTRARRHLWLSYAATRPTSTGKEGVRRPSRFLAQAGLVRDTRSQRVRVIPSAPPDAALRPSDEPLLGALRDWRRSRARTDGVPPYVIAHDETLAGIAAARPLSLAALRRVRGMGDRRLERYGDELLALVAAHR